MLIGEEERNVRLASGAERVTMKTLRWTLRDLELLPDDDKRYEIIDGELYVAKQPDWEHQFVCGRIYMLLQMWSDQTQLGMANIVPGIIFTDDNNRNQLQQSCGS